MFCPHDHFHINTNTTNLVTLFDQLKVTVCNKSNWGASHCVSVFLYEPQLELFLSAHWKKVTRSKLLHLSLFWLLYCTQQPILHLQTCFQFLNFTHKNLLVGGTVDTSGRKYFGMGWVNYHNLLFYTRWSHKTYIFDSLEHFSLTVQNFKSNNLKEAEKSVF